MDERRSVGTQTILYHIRVATITLQSRCSIGVHALSTRSVQVPLPCHGSCAMLPDRRDPCKDMHNHVCVVIGPHVVEAHEARHVLGPV